MLKKQRDKAQREVDRALETLGAVKSGWYDWRLETLAGPMLVSFCPGRHAKGLASLHCRFRDLDKARAFFGVDKRNLFDSPMNPYSGKWNHYADDLSDAPSAVLWVMSTLEKVVPAAGEVKS